MSTACCHICSPRNGHGALSTGTLAVTTYQGMPCQCQTKASHQQCLNIFRTGDRDQPKRSMPGGCVHKHKTTNTKPQTTRQFCLNRWTLALPSPLLHTCQACSLVTAQCCSLCRRPDTQRTLPRDGLHAEKSRQMPPVRLSFICTATSTVLRSPSHHYPSPTIPPCTYCVLTSTMIHVHTSVWSSGPI